jgi:hypothetical protein
MRPRKRALSNFIGAIILIAITVAGGLFVYGIVSSAVTSTIGTGPSVQFTSAGVSATGSMASFSVSAQNTGTAPGATGVSLSIVPPLSNAIAPYTPTDGLHGKGVLMYTVVSLPSNTYTFTFGAANVSEVFINGPGTNGWKGVYGQFYPPSGCCSTTSVGVTLSSGIWQIAFFGLNDAKQGWAVFSASLPVNALTFMLVWYYYYAPAGITLSSLYSAVLSNPLDLTGIGAEVAGAQIVQTSGSFDINPSWTSGKILNLPAPAQNNPALPLGLLNPGQSATYTWNLAVGWGSMPATIPVGQSFTSIAEAYGINGQTSLDVKGGTVAPF